MDFSYHKGGVRMLSALREVSGTVGNVKSQEELFQKACDALLFNEDYCFVWVGAKDPKSDSLIPLAGVTTSKKEKFDCLTLIEEISLDWDPQKNPAVIALTTKKPFILRGSGFGDVPFKFRELSSKAGIDSYLAMPICWGEKVFGVLNIFSKSPNSFGEFEIEFIKNITMEIALALHSMNVALELEREQDLSREILDAARALLISICHGGHILTFNMQAELVTGFSREEVKGKFWVDAIIPKEHRPKVQELFTALMKDDNNHSCDFFTEILCKDDTRRVVNWHASVLPSVEKTQAGIVLIGIDITDRLEADKALEQARSEWESVFNAIQDPIIITDMDGVVIDANPATCNASKLKIEQIIGTGICKLLHGGRPNGVECPLENLIKNKKTMILDTHLKGLNGDYLLTVSPISAKDGSIKRFLLAARDLTEEKIRKAESIRAGQLASIGELAAGVAHEINNPINGIINYAQILQDELSDDNINKGILDRIIHEGERIAYIIKNLLSFARQEAEDFEKFNLVEVIEDTIALIAHQLKKDCINLSVELDADFIEVYGHPQQLKQVFLNIISNARYALNTRYPCNDDNKRLDIKVIKKAKNNMMHVSVEITDYGTGMPQDILDKIFDPFFSSKPSGEGTGLGLSISHGIIRDHQGTLTIESVLEDHTKAIIELPIIPK